MTQLNWDQAGEKQYETGVDRGVLYLPDESGNYVEGFAWNGLTTVTESPSGAEANKQYADNGVYLNLQSAEEFGGTIEAFTYPLEFGVCDGTAEPEAGVSLGQQPRRSFGFAYRTLIGNDIAGQNAGYKLHLVYSALAAPSEKAHATVNDSPEAVAFSWAFSTTPVNVGTIGGTDYRPTSTVTIDSTRVDSAALADLEAMLYGTVGTDPQLPSPADVVALFSGTVTAVTPTQPTFDSGTHTITIPSVTGVVYRIDGVDQAAGPVVITEDTIVTAHPATGYKFNEPTDSDWFYDYV
jgi:hypothetical protein